MARPQTRSRAALVILDAINPFDFEGAEQISEAAIAASRVIEGLRAEADGLGIPTIYVNDNYGHWGSEKDEIVRDCAQGSAAADQIIGRLAPRPSDYFVIKPHYSGFYATNLTALLDRLDVGRLTITGFAADICVLFTAADAHMRGYELWVPADATASESGDHLRWTLENMAKSMKALTDPTDSLRLTDWAGA